MIKILLTFIVFSVSLFGFTEPSSDPTRFVTDFPIYVQGDVGFIELALNAAAMLAKDSDFKNLTEFAIGIAIIIAAWTSFRAASLVSLGKSSAIGIAGLSLMFAPVDTHVIDERNNVLIVGPNYTLVSNVPYLIALPASITSSLGTPLRNLIYYATIPISNAEASKISTQAIGSQGQIKEIFKNMVRGSDMTKSKNPEVKDYVNKFDVYINQCVLPFQVMGKFSAERIFLNPRGDILSALKPENFYNSYGSLLLTDIQDTGVVDGNNTMTCQTLWEHLSGAKRTQIESILLDEVKTMMPGVVVDNNNTLHSGILLENIIPGMVATGIWGVQNFDANGTSAMQTAQNYIFNLASHQVIADANLRYAGDGVRIAQEITTMKSKALMQMEGTGGLNFFVEMLPNSMHFIYGIVLFLGLFVGISALAQPSMAISIYKMYFVSFVSFELIKISQVIISNMTLYYSSVGAGAKLAALNSNGASLNSLTASYDYLSSMTAVSGTIGTMFILAIPTIIYRGDFFGFLGGAISGVGGKYVGNSLQTAQDAAAQKSAGDTTIDRLKQDEMAMKRLKHMFGEDFVPTIGAADYYNKVQSQMSTISQGSAAMSNIGSLSNQAGGAMIQAQKQISTNAQIGATSNFSMANASGTVAGAQVTGGMSGDSVALDRFGADAIQTSAHTGAIERTTGAVAHSENIMKAFNGDRNLSGFTGSKKDKEKIAGLENDNIEQNKILNEGANSIVSLEADNKKHESTKSQKWMSKEAKVLQDNEIAKNNNAITEISNKLSNASEKINSNNEAINKENQQTPLSLFQMMSNNDNNQLTNQIGGAQAYGNMMTRAGSPEAGFSQLTEASRVGALGGMMKNVATTLAQTGKWGSNLEKTVSGSLFTDDDSVQKQNLEKEIAKEKDNIKALEKGSTFTSGGVKGKTRKERAEGILKSLEDESKSFNYSDQSDKAKAKRADWQKKHKSAMTEKLEAEKQEYLHGKEDVKTTPIKTVKKFNNSDINNKKNKIAGLQSKLDALSDKEGTQVSTDFFNANLSTEGANQDSFAGKAMGIDANKKVQKDMYQTNAMAGEMSQQQSMAASIAVKGGVMEATSKDVANASASAAGQSAQAQALKDVFKAGGDELIKSLKEGGEKAAEEIKKVMSGYQRDQNSTANQGMHSLEGTAKGYRYAQSKLGGDFASLAAQSGAESQAYSSMRSIGAMGGGQEGVHALARQSGSLAAIQTSVSAKMLGAFGESGMITAGFAGQAASTQSTLDSVAVMGGVGNYVDTMAYGAQQQASSAMTTKNVELAQGLAVKDTSGRTRISNTGQAAIQAMAEKSVAVKYREAGSNAALQASVNADMKVNGAMNMDAKQDAIDSGILREDGELAQNAVFHDEVNRMAIQDKKERTYLSKEGKLIASQSFVKYNARTGEISAQNRVTDGKTTATAGEETNLNLQNTLIDGAYDFAGENASALGYGTLAVTGAASINSGSTRMNMNSIGTNSNGESIVKTDGGSGYAVKTQKGTYQSDAKGNVILDTEEKFNKESGKFETRTTPRPLGDGIHERGVLTGKMGQWKDSLQNKGVDLRSSFASNQTVNEPVDSSQHNEDNTQNRPVNESTSNKSHFETPYDKNIPNSTKSESGSQVKNSGDAFDNIGKTFNEAVEAAGSELKHSSTKAGGYVNAALSFGATMFGVSSMLGGTEAEAKSMLPQAQRAPQPAPQQQSIGDTFSQMTDSIGGQIQLGFNALTGAMGINEMRGGANSSIQKTMQGAMSNVSDIFGGKQVAEGAGTFMAKKLPGVGLALGAYGAFDRASGGDFAGAGMELASGVASLVPGLGTVASTGIDTALMARDAISSNQQTTGATSIFSPNNETNQMVQFAERQDSKLSMMQMNSEMYGNSQKMDDLAKITKSLTSQTQGLTMDDSKDLKRMIKKQISANDNP